MKKKLEQAVQHANETNPGSRNRSHPQASKKSKKQKTHDNNNTNEMG
ncbi:hypothetical protein [Metabacillus bambusae]|uniref:Small acid-soluble spore protein P n=1 Tax=Metabacillus bambusae TaxID=2795218 RepID=A0ABS3N286_9BACI|nr:hypothetical protein [Metabacillus bambusae]MBO1512199.1 hypothetical protein [Metabacillus bambusae]